MGRIINFFKNLYRFRKCNSKSICLYNKRIQYILFNKIPTNYELIKELDMDELEYIDCRKQLEDAGFIKDGIFSVEPIFKMNKIYNIKSYKDPFYVPFALENKPTR